MQEWWILQCFKCSSRYTELVWIQVFERKVKYKLNFFIYLWRQDWGLVLQNIYIYIYILYTYILYFIFEECNQNVVVSQIKASLQEQNCAPFQQEYAKSLFLHFYTKFKYMYMDSRKSSILSKLISKDKLKPMVNFNILKLAIYHHCYYKYYK